MAEWGMDTRPIIYCVQCEKRLPYGRRKFCSDDCSSDFHRHEKRRKRKGESSGDGVDLSDLVSRISELAKRCANEEPSEKLRLMGTALVDMILLAIPNFAERMRDGTVSASDMNTLAGLALRLPDIRESLESSVNRMVPKMLHVKFVRPTGECHNCGEPTPNKCPKCGVLAST